MTLQPQRENLKTLFHRNIVDKALNVCNVGGSAVITGAVTAT
jgi:hypothetical protein